MKTLITMLLILLASVSYAEDSFNGRVESVSEEAGILVLAGKEYRITGKTIVLAKGKRVSMDAVQPGLDIRYTLDFKSPIKPLVTKIELQLSPEQAAKVFNH